MPGEKDSFDEAEDIINESDETVEALVDTATDDALATEHEQYDETEEEDSNEAAYVEEGEPEELDFEPAPTGEDGDAA